MAPAQVVLPGAVANTYERGADMADAMSFPPIPGSAPHDEALRWLHAELTSLRAQLVDEVRTQRVTVVDPDGHPRIRLTTDGDIARVVLLTTDGVERLRLTASETEAHVQARALARTSADQAETDATHVDLFALDPDPEDPDDHPYVGLELIDRGTTVAGAALFESHRPKPWWTHPDDEPDQ